MTAVMSVDHSSAATQFSEPLGAAAALVPEAKRYLEAREQTMALESLRAARAVLSQDVIRVNGLIATTSAAKREASLEGEPLDLFDDELVELQLELNEAIRCLPEEVAIIAHGIFCLELLEATPR